MRSIAVTIAALVLGLAACGGDDDGIGEYADAIAAGVQADEGEDSLQTTDDQAQCIGDGVADVIGVDALEEVGTPEEVTEAAQDDLSAFDLDDGQATEAAQVTFDCIDDIVDQFIASFDTGSDEADQCLADKLGEDQMVPLLAKTLQGAEFDDPESAELVQELESVFQTCA